MAKDKYGAGERFKGLKRRCREKILKGEIRYREKTLKGEIRYKGKDRWLKIRCRRQMQ
ncbi:MAG: hypothetical protein IKA24_10155 [Mogibacterium sp.]|nr:hypothetical protein [Mogibacterium sp.]